MTTIPPKAKREPGEAAANDSRKQSERNGCLPWAPRSGWPCMFSFWRPYQTILRVQVENTTTINRTVDSIDDDHEKRVRAPSRNKHVIVVVELTAVNILHELSINNPLRQLHRLLHHPDVGPDVNAAARLLCDVRHFTLCRG